ncbi:MAG: sensor histidine kinase [Sulfuriferula sp.]
MKLSDGPAIDLKILLASNIHEIKNLMLQLMLRLDAMDSSQADVADARLLCHRVNDRMVQMLLLFELQTEKLMLNLKAHSPTDFIGEFVRNAAALAGGRIIIEMREQNVPGYWFFDRELIEMAMLNAVHNALRYARQRIVISAAMANDTLILTVEDDGGGYPQRILDQPMATWAHTPDGTGLGLFFAGMIAQAHVNNGRQGALVLHNKERDAGAIFILQLP